ncbi:hypothetical protein C8J57DRAFT_1494887 [Mycena rebaudengoi]|nr:hypothetical protein C8J57DRAFT_1494887 [Mycena rebaudengoi]
MELYYPIIYPSLLSWSVVFEAAAFLDNKNIPRLLLVAHRVHEWLEPLLYHVLVYRSSPTQDHTLPHRIRAILSGSAAGSTHFDFLKRHVRHLAFTDSDFPYIAEYCKACSGATSVAFFGNGRPSFIPHLDQIRPLKLSVNIGGLFGGPHNFSRPMFANITHFDISDHVISSDAENERSRNSITSLPRLTHLAFKSGRLPDGFLNRILSGCQLLQALILLLYPTKSQSQELQAPENYLYYSAFPIHDVRFIITFCPGFLDDWVTGARGGADMWVQADNFIRLKRRGDISAGQTACSTADTALDGIVTLAVLFSTSYIRFFGVFARSEVALAVVAALGVDACDKCGGNQNDGIETHD